MELEKTRALLNKIVACEVNDWLNDVLDAVVDNVCCEGAKKRRMTYAIKRKVAMVDVLHNLEREYPDASKVELQQKIRKASGNNKLRVQTVERWNEARCERKRGRKVNTEFEQHILDELVYTTVEKVNNQETAVVMANVCYSHDLIRLAAEKVRQQPQWKDDTRIQNLKFRRSWVRGWLRRCAMRKRRITAQEKTLPPPEKVQERMRQIQETVVAGGFARGEVFNGDETGVLFGALPLTQYIPFDADRATAPEGDDKARFTAFLYGSAEGNMEPAFIITKCTSKNSFDLSSTRVVQNLHALPDYSAVRGWTLKNWERQIMLPAKKNAAPSLVTCKRPYLIHFDGTVITCQNRAWMDSAGMCMWVDVQLGPRRQGSKTLMVWDNCGPHKVAAVRQVFEDWNIKCEELPPKMTDILQVMDLVVNGPLKASIRRHRVHGLFDYFQSWKIARLQAVAQGVAPPSFNPPKPKLAHGVRALLDALGTSLQTPEFKANMARTFVKVGLWSTPSSGFVEYTSHKKLGSVGLLPSTEKAVAHELTDDDPTTSFGEIAAEVSIVTRCGEELEGEQQDGGGEEGDADEDVDDDE